MPGARARGCRTARRSSAATSTQHESYGLGSVQDPRRREHRRPQCLLLPGTGPVHHDAENTGVRMQGRPGRASRLGVPGAGRDADRGGQDRRAALRRTALGARGRQYHRGEARRTRTRCFGERHPAAEAQSHRTARQRLACPVFPPSYTLPKEVNEVLDATIGGLLKEDLLQAGLATEAQRFNIPHVRSSGDDAVAVAEHSFRPLARSRRGHYM